MYDSGIRYVWFSSYLLKTVAFHELASRGFRDTLVIHGLDGLHPTGHVPIHEVATSHRLARYSVLTVS